MTTGVAAIMPVVVPLYVEIVIGACFVVDAILL